MAVVVLAACGPKKQKGEVPSSVDVSAFYQGDEQLKPQDITVHCVVKEPSGEKLLLSVNGKEQVYDVPVDGKLDIKLSHVIPQYSGITYGVKYFPLYIGGNEPVGIEFSANPDDWKVTFSGSCEDINKYLFHEVNAAGADNFRYDEERLAKETEQLWQKNLENLKNKDLPEEFKAYETERLKYYAYIDWNSYAFNHRWMTGNPDFVPSEVYYKKLEEIADENVMVFSLPVYRRLLERVIPVLAAKGQKELSPKDLTTKEVEYVMKKYQHPLLQQYLLDHFISGYISEYGTEGAEDLLAIYKNNIADTARLDQMDEIVEDWGKLKEGDVSPLFDYVNAEGQNVSLASFRGKYVYIDLWASWCGPCRREIPALKQLEKKLAGKPIVFVSISCDKDAEAWKTAMKEENLEGVQLIAGEDLSFLKAYRVQAIPRFILLDPEGRIVNARMTPPSDPETEKTLSALLK